MKFIILSLFTLRSRTHGVDAGISVRIPLLHEVPETVHEAEGLLRQEYASVVKQHRHPNLITTAERMDPLEFRAIDPINGVSELVDEINYLRSFSVAECYEVVCSKAGKRRFAECASSILSEDRKCRPGCQDHLKMWVLHRCYLVETFDCAGNIGPHSVDQTNQVFNPEGPQSLSQFTVSMRNLFQAKGVDCQCCDFSSVVVTKDESTK
jgi:hypothetical protein